jgi:thioredoxin 1
MSSLNITDLSDTTFAEEIEQYPGIAVVDFWASWCGPCQAVAPILEELAVKHAGKVKVAKLDVDQNPEITGRYGIQAMPTLILFKDGKEAARNVGALVQKKKIEDFINASIMA